MLEVVNVEFLGEVKKYFEDKPIFDYERGSR